MKKISWVTPEAYLDTDLYIIPLLCPYYDIDWHVVSKGKTLYDEELKHLRGTKKIKIFLDVISSRIRSLKTLVYYYRLAKEIKKKKPDYIYTGLNGYPYALPIFKTVCGSIKTVVPVHNVNTPRGASNYHFAKWNVAQVLKSYHNFQTFSLSQFNLLKTLKQQANVFYIPFLLKDYGIPVTEPSKKITFLSFGNIRDYKRVDVLIEAAQQTYEKTAVDFIVEIAGSCDNWSKYQDMIRYPQLFHLNIRKIDNDEVPDLFGRSHYFVVPYQDIAQSGSVVVGINYDKPVIASDLEAFREYVKDGVDGFLMKPASVDSLVKIMIKILQHHDHIYPKLIKGLRQMKTEHFAKETIVEKYCLMFESLK